MIRKLTAACTPVALIAALVGCTTHDTPPPDPTQDSSRNPELLQPDLYPAGAVHEPEVRYGRYTLVNTAPDVEQRDLMAQIIDVQIPANMHPSVRDAMQYITNRSGYVLCGPEQANVNILYTRPLPAAQYKIGPMSLRNALQVLAGPAWQVKVDEVMRSVCFVLRPGYQLPEAPRYAPAPSLNAPSAPIASGPTVITAAAPASPPLQVATAKSVGTVSTAKQAVAPTASAARPASTPAAAKAQPEQPQHDLAKEGSPQVMPSQSTTTSPTTFRAPDSTQASIPLVKPAPMQAESASIKAVPVSAPAPAVPQMLKPLPSPIASAKPAFAPAPAQQWDAAVGTTLRQSVEAWAKRAGWQVIWEADDLDYPIMAPLHFQGTFAEVIAQLFPLYDSARRSFVVDGNSSQHVLHVSERKKL